MFFNIGNTAVDLQGKLVMFVGDTRTPTQDPTPVIFATKKKAWEWVTKVVVTDPGVYVGDQLKLFTLEFGQTMGEISVPRLFVLLHLLAKILHSKGQCIPHIFWAAVKDFIASKDTRVAAEKFKLVLDWCLLAAQQDAAGRNQVAHTMEVPLSEDDGFCNQGQTKGGDHTQSMPSCGRKGGRWRKLNGSGGKHVQSYGPNGGEGAGRQRMA